MNDIWFVYRSNNYEEIQFVEEVYTHYSGSYYDVYTVSVMDGNKNYDYYDFVVTKLKVIDNVDKQKEEATK